MLKKRILAFQAAIMLSASMMASVVAPVGNIAIVHAAEPAKNPITWDYIRGIESKYKYDPGHLDEKYTGTENKVVTGDKIKLIVHGATSPTTNYKVKIDYTKEDGTKVYGVRTINEKPEYKEQPFAISEINTYNGTNYEAVDPAKYAEYATVDPSGNVTVVGKGKFHFTVSKRFEGTSTWTVVDTYEDKITDNQSIKRMKEVWNPDTYEDEYVEDLDGYTISAHFVANNEDPTGTNYRYSSGYGTKDYKEEFPINKTFKIHGTDGYGHWEDIYDDDGHYMGEEYVYEYDTWNDEIRAGESSVITLDAYEPMDTSSRYEDNFRHYYGNNPLVYNKYDSATDTYTQIGAVRTITESIVGQPKTEWTISSIGYRDEKGLPQVATDAATIAKYGEVKNGVFVGKKACEATVTVTYTVTSNFTATNIWNDGVTEQYKFNQGYKDGKETDNTAVYTRTARITVIDANDDYDNFYNRPLRLDDIDYNFGGFGYQATTIEIGKGETKSVAAVHGTYVPTQDTNTEPYERQYVFYDNAGKRQVRRAQYTLTENNKSITHEYKSSNEARAKVDANGNVTGNEPGLVTITDTVKIRSTFTVTFKWDDGITQSVETGEKEATYALRTDVEVVDDAKGVQNFDVVTVGNAKYTVMTDTKTAIFKAPTKKTFKKVTVPASIKVNGLTFKVVGIEANALKGCKKLTTFSSKAKIEYVGANIFSGCTALKTADLTNFKLAEYPDATWKTCKKVKTLTINGNSLMYVQPGAFDGVKDNITIIIKCKNRTVYRKVVEAFKDAGYDKFTFKYKKYTK